MTFLLSFTSSTSHCIPASLPQNSLSNSSASVLLLPDGTELFHAYPLYLERYNKAANFSERYLLNPSLDVVKDSIYIAAATTLFLIVRFLLSGAQRKGFRFRHALFIVLAKTVLPVEPKKVSKFAECLWFVIWHSVSLTWTIFILRSQMGTEESPMWVRLLLNQMSGRWYWLTPRAELVAGSNGWPYIFVPPFVKWFYLSELSFWCSSMIYISIETPRKDFYIMLMHHIATCVLLIFSYIFSLWKIGQIILLLHDVVDIFLYSSKCTNYCTFTKTIAQILFLMLIITYFVARLILYSLCCVYPILTLSQLTSDTCGIVSTYWEIPGAYLFPSFLLTLVVLHCYWFGLILKVAWGVILQIFGFAGEKVIDDIRSESGGEEQFSKAKKVD